MKLYGKQFSTQQMGVQVSCGIHTQVPEEDRLLGNAGRHPGHHTWLAGKAKCGRCRRALKSMGNHAGTQYLRCTKRADNMSCEGCGTIRTTEFERFVYEAMVHKLFSLFLVILL